MPLAARLRLVRRTGRTLERSLQVRDDRPSRLQRRRRPRGKVGLLGGGGGEADREDRGEGGERKAHHSRRPRFRVHVLVQVRGEAARSGARYGGGGGGIDVNAWIYFHHDSVEDGLHSCTPYSVVRTYDTYLGWTIDCGDFRLLLFVGRIFPGTLEMKPSNTKQVRWSFYWRQRC